MGKRWNSLQATVGLAASQLRYDRRETLIAVVGVALAVLGTTLLMSVGLGVVDFGQAKFDSSGRDLWVSGGPVEFRPGSAGGIQNSLVNAHELQDQLRARNDVKTANPLIFQTVYTSPNRSSFSTIAAVGAATRGPAVSIKRGRAINESSHYANGAYEGPMVYEVLVDQRVAAKYNVSVGDHLYIGGTTGSARQHNFTIVGISNTYTQFVGAPTVVVEPSELQEITGSTASDRATYISVQVAENVSVSKTAARLRAAYPEYTIRTNDQQIQSILAGKAVVIASGISLIGLAVFAGIALTLNLLLSTVFQRQREFAAIQALGTSSSMLVGTVVVRSLGIAVLGGIIGCGLTVPGVMAANAVAEAVTGFSGLAILSTDILLAGFGIGIITGILGAAGAGLYLFRGTTINQLS